MTRKQAIAELKAMKTTHKSLDMQGINSDVPMDEESIQALDMAISALSENKGEWVKYGVPRCGEQHYKCTSCGYYINFGQWGELYTKEFKYCPNCGADMRGE